MTTYAKLTSHSIDQHSLWLALDLIESMEVMPDVSKKKTFTHICMRSGDYLQVLETPKQILALIEEA